MMCAISETPFSDERHSAPCTDAALIDINLGRMPVCVTANGVSIGQSAAICNYIASTQGFLGANAEEAGQIFSWVESLREMLDMYNKLVPYATEPTAEALHAFFEEAGAADVTGVADGAARGKRGAKWFLGRLERLTSKAGPFAVGSKISLADVMLFRLFKDEVPRDDLNKDLPAYRLQPFSAGEQTAKLLAGYPNISAIISNVGANQALQKYLAARPKYA